MLPLLLACRYDDDMALRLLISFLLSPLFSDMMMPCYADADSAAARYAKIC